MLSYLIVFLSFLLEITLSNIFYGDSLFINLFTILSLYVVYPFFKKKKRTYYLLSLIMGFLYDLILMPNFGINLIIFTIFAVLISVICDNFEETFLNSIFACLLIVVLYRSLTYICFLLINNIKYDYFVYIKAIYSSIFINIIYICLLYIFLRKKKSKL